MNKSAPKNNKQAESLQILIALTARTKRLPKSEREKVYAEHMNAKYGDISNTH